MITAIAILSAITILLFFAWFLFDLDIICISIKVPSTIGLLIIAIIVLAAIVLFQKGEKKMEEEYVYVRDLIQWLLDNAPEDAIVCSSEEGNPYSIYRNNLYVDEYDERDAVFIG